MSTTTKHRAAIRPRSTGLHRLLVILDAAVAALAVWVVAVPLADVDLTVQLASDAAARQVGPVTIAVVALLVGSAGWALLALLERVMPHRARRIWTVTAVVALTASLTGPLAATTTAATTALLTMHLAVAGVLVPMLTRSARRP